MQHIGNPSIVTAMQHLGKCLQGPNAHPHCKHGLLNGFHGDRENRYYAPRRETSFPARAEQTSGLKS